MKPTPDVEVCAEVHEEEPVRWRTAGPTNPAFPPEDWRYEVANGDTELGYHDWVEHKLESDR